MTLDYKNDYLGRLNWIQESILKIAKSCQHNAKGLRGMKERGFSDAGMLEKVIEVTAIQCDMMSTLASVCYAYTNSDKFASDMAMSMAIEQVENKK